MKTTALACTLAAFALVAACGGGGEATPPPAAPAPSATEMPSAAPAATETTAPGPGEWDKWSHDQKLAWMKAGVMPKMHDLFASYDSAKYADAKCKLCHG